MTKIGRYEASSQTCSECGHKDGITKDLKIREWTCPECGSVHDRDVNAAKNILRFGVAENTTGKGVSPDGSRGKTGGVTPSVGSGDGHVSCPAPSENPMTSVVGVRQKMENEKRIKEIVAAAKEHEYKSEFSDIVKSPLSKGVNSAYGIGFMEGAAWADENPKENMNNILEEKLIDGGLVISGDCTDTMQKKARMFSESVTNGRHYMDLEIGFIRGYQTAVKNACEWLMENLSMYSDLWISYGEIYNYNEQDDIIKDLKKAMEE